MSTSSNKLKQKFQSDGEGKIDKGGGGGSISETVLCEELCVTKMMCDKVVCKRLCVMVCSKHVCVCGRWRMTKLPATKLCVRKMVCVCV